MAIALSLNPPLINHSFKSLNSPCYLLQNSLQVFGVFVLMGCKKCTEYSRCALTHHTGSKSDQDTVRHEAAPQRCQRCVTQPFSLLPNAGAYL